MPGDALHGIRVLDFSWVLAGPYATRILADFGAEVIKLQSAKTARGAEPNATGYFNTWNRNKLGITLDLSRPEGRELALKLVGMSDVVAENFTPRVMSNWQLDYENLVRVKPDLIMVSLSGMGQTGPWRDFTAFGATIQALSGMTCLTSFAQGPPVGLGYAYADQAAGLFATLAVLAALEHRDRTGEGQYIDLSEYEAMCSLLGPAMMDYTLNHHSPTPRGNSPDYTLAAPYGCYRCRGNDRWCVIAVFSEEEWLALCRILGTPPWTEEARFSTLTQRQEHAEELDKLLEQWTVKHHPEEVMRLLQEAGIPCGVVQDAREVAQDPQLVAREFFIQADHPILGQTTSDSTPIRLSRTPARFRQAAPLLGQDNRYVFRELLGIDDKALSRYIADGIIGQSYPDQPNGR
ncbi:CaiB/BaiF CoA transferase family protein [Chloroflexota bacterium]